MLTDRQRIAMEVTRQLGEMEHVWVTSPPGQTETLTVVVYDCCRNELIGGLQECGLEPGKPNLVKRVDPTHPTGFKMALEYKLDISSVKNVSEFHALLRKRDRPIVSLPAQGDEEPQK